MALSGNVDGVRWLDGVITFRGRQDTSVREAAIVVLSFNLLAGDAGVGSIMLTMPRGKKPR